MSLGFNNVFPLSSVATQCLASNAEGELRTILQLSVLGE